MYLILLDGLYIYDLLVWSNLNFLHNSLQITMRNQSCIVLYAFNGNLLHSLIMWLVVSSLSPTFANFLRLIYSRFDKIGSYGIDLCCYLEIQFLS